jgi:hypothetical protein
MDPSPTPMRLILLLAIVLLTACSSPTNYSQENYSLPPPAPKSMACLINGIETYQSSYFIYHNTTIGDQVIYSPTGTYTKPEDYPRWQYRPFNDLNGSMYNETMGFIKGRRLPNGLSVACNRTEELPASFKEFIKGHEQLYRGKFRLPDDAYEI